MEALDIENLCRMCLNSSPTQVLSKKHTILNINYYSMLNDCTSVQAQIDDNLPSKMCKKCEKLLVKYYQFRNSVKENDTKLKHFVESKINIGLLDFPVKIEESVGIKQENEEKNENVMNRGETTDVNNVNGTIKPIVSQTTKKKQKIKIKKPQHHDFDDETESLDDEPIIKYKTNKLKKLQLNNEVDKEENDESMMDNDEISDTNNSDDETKPAKEKSKKKKHQSKKVKKPTQCDDCGKFFKSNSCLQRHVVVHSSERPFVCEICGKGYKLGLSLSEHKKRHTEEFKFKCSVCPKTFKFAQYLKTHLNVHSQERSYICNYCGKLFGSSSCLSVHTRIHTGVLPYECEYCHRKFRQKTTLKAHYRVHTGERPYQCQTCGKTYKNSNIYVAHKRIHTGETPYKCKFCTNSYRTKVELNKHIESH